MDRPEAKGTRHLASASRFAAGFDAMRLLAAILVFTQHTFTILGHDAWIQLGDLSFGRFGTAAFLALSGYLAASTRRVPETWLGLRAQKLLPAYWVVLTLSFLAVDATDYKEFDSWQVVCQFTGIGLFTHQDRLVSVTTWFVSALLMLYVVVYLGMRTRDAVVWLVLLAAMAIGIDGSSRFETVAIQSVTFLVAYLVGRSRVPHGILLLGVAGLLACLAFDSTGFWYGAVALMSLAVARHWTASWNLGRAFGGIAYEWFLIHGLCIHAVARLVGDLIWIVLPLAASLSIMSALLLRDTIARCGLWLSRRASHGQSSQILTRRFRPEDGSFEAIPVGDLGEPQKESKSSLIAVDSARRGRVE